MVFTFHFWEDELWVFTMTTQHQWWLACSAPVSLCRSQEPGAAPRDTETADWASGVRISQGEAPGVSLCHSVIVFCINPQLRNVMTGCHWSADNRPRPGLLRPSPQSSRHNSRPLNVEAWVRPLLPKYSLSKNDKWTSGEWVGHWKGNYCWICVYLDY